MVYVLSFGRADSRILGVFTSQEQAETAREQIVRSQIHPPTTLFVEEYEENQLTVESDMLV